MTDEYYLCLSSDITILVSRKCSAISETNLYGIVEYHSIGHLKFQKIDNKNIEFDNKNIELVFELKALETKLRVFLAGHTVGMITYFVTKIITTCAPMIWQLFDTMIVASTDIEWLK